jgi:hypothetical protein
MVYGVATLIVDLGNSETRVKTYFGRTQKGNRRSKLSYISNVFSTIEREDDLQRALGNSEYNGNNSKVFSVNGIKYCNGMIQDSEFNATSFRPTAQDKKYTSLSTKLSMYCAFMRGYEDISRWTQTDIESLSVEWNVTVLLPAGDLDLGAEKLADMIKNLGSLNFEMPNVKKDLNILRVNVLPEGFAALLGVMFQSYGKLRPGYEQIADKDTYTLIIDIGAGTTDISVAKGGKVISNSRKSVEVGGNNVQVAVKKMLSKKGLNRIKDTWFREACETGILRVGVNRLEIFDEINSAKSMVAVKLVNAIKEFLEENTVDIMDVSYLLVCGGGAVVNEGITELEPIANYITKYLAEISMGIELIDMPDYEDDGEILQVSPRLLNIIGASIASEGFMS